VASDAQAAAGPQAEIVAKPRYDPGSLLAFILPFALALVVTFLIAGIVGATVLSLLGILAGSFIVFGIRYREFRRALLDSDGATVRPRGGGWLSARPVHFRWEEVLEAREMSFRRMRLRLDRPRKFWTFHRQPKRAVRIPEGIWANQQFAEALRAHVPPERVRAGQAFDERLSWSARHRRLLTAVMLLCAATASYGFLISPGERFMAHLLLTVALEYVVVLAAIALCVDHAPPAFKVAAGFLAALALLAPRVFLLAMFYPQHVRLIIGYWGTFAGALLGAALMVIIGKRYRGWRYTGLNLLLAAVGFCCTWASSSQVTSVRIDVGGLGYTSPWTPKGDAFLMTEGDSDTERTLCWYSSDLQLERRAGLASSSQRLAIGEEAALFRIGREQDSQLLFVPRHSEQRVIDTTAFFGPSWRCRTSQDSRYVLVPILDVNGDTVAQRICDLETGKVEPVNFPVPLKDISVFALRNDRTVLWLSGSFPLDKNNNRWAWANPVPENGEFPHPGKAFGVWAWKVNSPDPPAQLYAARTQWLGWTHSSHPPEQLRVRRVSEKPPLRAECVSLDFTQSPPAEKAISEDDFHVPWLPQNSSHDGRFEGVGGRAGSLGAKFIFDARTGKKFRMPGFFEGSLPAYWSPSENKFLMEVAEVKLVERRWHWYHNLDEAFGGNLAVYFVDMDRQ
jgi:hypothetical protein